MSKLAREVLRSISKNPDSWTVETNYFIHKSGISFRTDGGPSKLNNVKIGPDLQLGFWDRVRIWRAYKRLLAYKMAVQLKESDSYKE